jgi:AbrB family looped-hinge helix DNA binding protein
MIISKSVKLSKKGQLVVPLQMREALGLKEGDTLLLTLNDTQITLTRPEHFARATRGLLKGTWGRSKHDVERYLTEERKSWE